MNQAYVAEIIGTAILILLGQGVVANVVLARTKGHGSGWIVITAGWGLAVFVAVACTARFSGAHINPAVTVGTAMAGVFDVSKVAGYIASQIVGAMLGATMAWLVYRPHYEATEDPAAKLGTFATAPAIRAPAWNLLAEIVGTFVLVITVLYFSGPVVNAEPGRKVTLGLGSLGAMPSGMVVFAIGLSLGGPTGYAINPARDLGPRIAHALLPIRGKGPSDWSYAWIPVAGPLIGAALAAGLYGLLGK